MMNKLNIDHIIDQWPSNLDGHLHYCVGLSGGVDSVVILHLFSEICKHKRIKLSAIHVNHGISSNANLWADFCESICKKLEIPLKICKIKVEKIAGEGLENSARKLRYKEYINNDADIIILAHHQDDQIETMISQIIRGSNLHNMAGMRTILQKNNKIFWRPILNHSKTDIHNYAKSNNLINIIDESNLDNHYLRNFIRNHILPQLEEYDVNVKIKLMQSIRELQNAASLVDELAAIDLMTCTYNNPNQLNKAQFCTLSNSRQINLLGYFIKINNQPLPSNKRLSEFARQINTAKKDRMPCLQISPSAILKSTSNHITLII